MKLVARRFLVPRKSSGGVARWGSFGSDSIATRLSIPGGWGSCDMAVS